MSLDYQGCDVKLLNVYIMLMREEYQYCYVAQARKGKEYMTKY